MKKRAPIQGMLLLILLQALMIFTCIQEALNSSPDSMKNSHTEKVAALHPR